MVIVIGLTIVYFGIVKPITNKLGLTRSREERQGDRAEERLSRKQIISPLLYKKNPELASITSGRASQLANDIWEGKGYVWDDEDKGVGGITSAGSHLNISRVADTFQRVQWLGSVAWCAHALLVRLRPREHVTKLDVVRKAKSFV